VTVVVEQDGQHIGQLKAPVHNPLTPVDGLFTLNSESDSLFTLETATRGSIVALVMTPYEASWPELAYPIPPNWTPLAGTARIGDAPAPDPELRRDRTGQHYLYWNFGDRAHGPVTVQLRGADSLGSISTVRIAALRTAEERAADRQQTTHSGPGVEVFALPDGAVVRNGRVDLGVRGAPGEPVSVFDGDSLVAEAKVPVDGAHRFIALPLDRGPHRLRVRMQDSRSRERWDSLAVHVTGLPAALEASATRIQLTADGYSAQDIQVRVLDEWGVPVVEPVYVTVSAEGATPDVADDDPSVAGVQVQSDASGWLTIRLKPGHVVRRGKLTLVAGEATHEIDLELLPAVRPLMVTGVGRLGLGASPDAFGALTARGRLDARTSVVLSVDSRRLNAFDRSFDPLDEAQYPLLGDASRTRTITSSRFAVSARLERGFDWIQFGDVATNDFASGLRLTTYRRAVTGGAAHVTTGPIAWRGFGSLTSQTLQQLQIRGAGSSGPYLLASDITPGTEHIVIETRERENPQRVVTSEVLTRFVDYQIDYESGVLLFKRPVPAADTQENPVFLMVTYEAASGADQRIVGGLRATVNARRLFGPTLLDSARIGLTGIYADELAGRFHLAGADLRLLRFSGLDVGGEVSYSETPDSSGIATSIDGSVALFGGAMNLSAGWMRIGSGFANPSNTALRAGTEALRLGGSLRVGLSQVRVLHNRQTFGAQNVQRQNTSAGIVQPLGPHLRFEAGQTTDRFDNAGSIDESMGGEAKLVWTPASALRFWAEGRRQFSYSGNLVRPDHLGAGAGLRIGRDLSLEVRHRQVLPPNTDSYAITNFGLRSDLGFGTQAWGSYQLAGGNGAQYNAAIIGLNNRLKLGPTTINTMFERRFGLNQADITDPVRSLPFVQNEEDYWSAGLGIELLPSEAPYRLSARSEYRDGALFSTRLVTMAGDVSINRSLAILSRQEYMQTEQNLPTGSNLSRRLSTLWGLALRPIHTDALNMLTKFSWLKETNPLGGGVLAPVGEEARTIGAAEVIWAPTGHSELAGRYAIRRTLADRLHEDGMAQRLESWADYVGGRLNYDLSGWLALRGDGRALYERTSDTWRWDAAPSLALRPIAGFELAGGYRFGDLRDPDFSVRGGHGWFVTFSARITEKVFPTAADFWRLRF
jgi:hypothetical protein